MSLPSRRSREAFSASFFVAILLAGCGIKDTVEKVLSITGYWRVSSTASSASRLSGLSGQLRGTTAGPITGVLHAESISACLSPATAVVVAGSTTADRQVTLTGALAGGTLTVQGTLAEDGKSLTDATYKVEGGACTIAVPVGAVVKSTAPGQD